MLHVDLFSLIKSWKNSLNTEDSIAKKENSKPWGTILWLVGREEQKSRKTKQGGEMGVPTQSNLLKGEGR